MPACNFDSVWLKLFDYAFLSCLLGFTGFGISGFPGFPDFLGFLGFPGVSWLFGFPGIFVLSDFRILLISQV